MKWEILDSGASRHFLITSAPFQAKGRAMSTIQIRLRSTHTYEMDIPQLPKEAILAHIVPVFADHSLVSVVKLCNSGCQVKTTDTRCEVIYGEKHFDRKEIHMHRRLYDSTHRYIQSHARTEQRRTRSNWHRWRCIKHPAHIKPSRVGPISPLVNVLSPTFNHLEGYRKQATWSFPWHDKTTNKFSSTTHCDI